MADRAIGKACPNCGTLVACAGNHGDEVLVGSCSYCKTTVTAQNHNIINGVYVPVVATSEDDVKAEDVQAALDAAEENAAAAQHDPEPEPQVEASDAASQ